jgi:hypothetical protein
MFASASSARTSAASMSRIVRRMIMVRFGSAMKRRGAPGRSSRKTESVTNCTRACSMNEGSNAGEHTDSFNCSAVIPLAESYASVCQKIVRAT